MPTPRTTTRPGNIDHSAHVHPDTSHWKGKCRKQMLAGDGPIRLRGTQVERYNALINNGVSETAAWNDAWQWDIGAVTGSRTTVLDEAANVGAMMMRKEAEASTALDKGDGQTFAVEAEPGLPEGYTLVPVERPAVIVRLGIIQELDAMLADLDPILDGFATTKSAVIRFDKDGQELAAVWDGEAWAVEVR